MNLKSLLLGSAAALSTVTSGYAADSVNNTAIIVEPVSHQNVEVCDAFGKGYFYVPGSETCLQIGGYVRFEVKFGGIDTGSTIDGDWSPYAKALLSITTKTDTEIGVLSSVFQPMIYAYANGDGTEVELDNAYIDVGSAVQLRAGYFKSYWDDDLYGELDKIDNVTKNNSIRVAYAANGFTAGLALDALSASDTGANSVKLGISGRLAYALSDSHYIKLDGAYDGYDNATALRLMTGFGIGPGTFELAGLYASAMTPYAPDFTANNWNDSPIAGTYMKYAVAADYYFNVADNVVLVPQVQYNVASNNRTFWEAGTVVDWEVVKDLHAKANINYAFLSSDWNQQNVFGWFRLERDF
ncbi:porin [Martelella sp. HB161492]|uniref:porin n=1 Tax=Martelella sp. HB161492 TaxID=2720726 RepID=UPI00158FEA30|nr:porin [Martelella sp. HB161492]